MYIRGTLQVTGTVPQTVPRPAGFYLIWSLQKRYLSRFSAMSQFEHLYCTISTVSSRILTICWPRWPINFLLSSSNLKQGLFSWPLRVTELTVEMVQYSKLQHRENNILFTVSTRHLSAIEGFRKEMFGRRCL